MSIYCQTENYEQSDVYACFLKGIDKLIISSLSFSRDVYACFLKGIDKVSALGYGGGDDVYACFLKGIDKSPRSPH